MAKFLLNILTFVLYLKSGHPEVYQKQQKEVWPQCINAKLQLT